MADEIRWNNIDRVVSEQISSFKGSYANKPFPKNVLMLVNYMPVMKFMEDYVEIREENAKILEKQGFKADIRENFKVTLNHIPGYAFILGVVEPSNQKSNGNGNSNNAKNTSSAKLYVHFKANPNGKDNPPLVKVRRKDGDKYYLNPNVIPIADVINEINNTSIINKHITPKMKPNKNDWRTVYSMEEIVEFPSLNYISHDFYDIREAYRHLDTSVFKTDGDNVYDDIMKYYNTHMMIAHTELGHYYATYRSKASYNPPLIFAYNNEFVPIYYNLGIKSPITETKCVVETDTITWADYLLRYLQPKNEIIDKFINVPEECQNIVMQDTNVRTSIKGDILNKSNNEPVYYLSRLDHGLLTNGIFSKPRDNESKDTYSYRLTMPYLFTSLFTLEKSEIMDGSVRSIGTIPEYYSPDDWVVKLHTILRGNVNDPNAESINDYNLDNSTEGFTVEENNDNKIKEDTYIIFDVKPRNMTGVVVVNDYISYSKFAFNSRFNFINPNNDVYHYASYLSGSTNSTVDIDACCTRYTEKGYTMLNSYYSGYLKMYFPERHN